MFHRKKGHKQKRSSFKSRNNESKKQRKNQQQRTSEKDDIDRLSDLPEPIIHQILLCLPLADTISTKSLSRQWWHTVWPSCPILYFDEYCFRANYFQFVDDDWERREKFTRFLQRSLTKQKKCVNGCYNTDKFGLRMVSSDYYSDSIIAKWVQFALESNAKELDLRIKRVDWACFKTYNRLVDDVFVAQSITVLYLEYCNIRPSCSINLPCLKKLTLSESKIRDNVFKKLIQGCPLIEYLCVEFCKHLQHIEVSIPNLKSLKLNFSGLYKVAIASMNLSSVELSGDFDAEVDFAAFATVKDMTLKNVTITDVELEHLISWCPMLVSLVIDGCNKLERIRVCCELLKRFVMLRCRRMMEAEFDTPNLVSFEYSGDLMYFKWVNRLRSVDAKINLDPMELDADWYIGLRRFVKQLMYSKFLTLICRSDQIWEERRQTRAIKEQDKHKNMISNALRDTKNNIIKLSRSGISSQEVELVDIILFFNLGSCLLAESLPTSIGRLSKDLYYFNIRNNRMTGNIPEGIGNLSGLVSLYLWGNQFSGTIPVTVGKLGQLQRLYLNQNKLVGPIPDDMGQMTNLGLLDLGANMISGSIPLSLGRLTQLRYLYLSHNLLSGIIPTELVRSSNLMLLDLSFNNLNGYLPTEVELVSYQWQIRGGGGSLHKMRMIMTHNSVFQEQICSVCCLKNRGFGKKKTEEI
ncbi:unnamed protein product [Camellia sinensis]